MERKKRKKPTNEKKTPEIVTNFRCLLIEYNGKKLFTYNKNLPILIPFAKKFSAKITAVMLENGEIFEAEVLVAKINESFSSESKYETIATKFPVEVKVDEKKNEDNANLLMQTPKKLTRKESQKQVAEIIAYIKEQLSVSDIVTTTNVMAKFPNKKVKQATIAGYIRKAKQELRTPKLNESYIW